MPDWLCVEVMGRRVDVALYDLSAADSLLVESALRGQSLPAGQIRQSIEINARGSSGRDPVKCVARELGRALCDLHPERWWLRILGTFVVSGGDVVLVVGSANGTIPFDDDAGVVGIDAERGVDPILCLSGDFSWTERPSDSSTRAVERSILRVSRIVVAEQSPGVESGVQELSDRDTLESLLYATVGAEHLRRPLAAMKAVLDAIGGVVLIRYSSLADLQPLIREVAGNVDISPSPKPLRRPLLEHAPHAGTASSSLYSGRVIDAVELAEGQIALASPDGAGVSLQVLDSEAAGIWLAAREGTNTDIAQMARSRMMGEAAPESMVEANVARMIAEGILDQEPSWTVAPGVVWRSSGGHTYVLATHDSVPPICLRESAHYIWQTLSDANVCSVARLAELVSAHYQMPVDAIADQIGVLLEDLYQRGLVTSV